MSDHFDYQAVFDGADPFAGIPPRYNLGAALTAGNVPLLGDRVALFWENTDGQKQQYTYAQLDRLTNQLAGSLASLGAPVPKRESPVPSFSGCSLPLADEHAVSVEPSASAPEVARTECRKSRRSMERGMVVLVVGRSAADRGPG